MGFKKDFIWGAATASYQIEGAWDADGKGRSVWDDFVRRPGIIEQGHTGDVACDHYHRYREDAALMAELGIRNYRLSLSWPRLLPEGDGKVNQAGLDFYDRLFDALLENGVRPFVTLFHWDYPSALLQRGAWLNPDSVKWFADYTELVARHYGDRVKDFFTLNEPQCFVGLGYGSGGHAPGARMPHECTIPMAHRVLLAHGAAVDVLRSEIPGVKIGYAPCGSVAVPVTDDPADIEAARQSYMSMGSADSWYWSTTWWSDPVMLGRYPGDGLALVGQYLPKGWEKDLSAICRPLDYYGQNLYYGHRVRAGADGKPETLPPPVGEARTAIGWGVLPEVLYWGPRFSYERYHTPVVITENGMSAHDAVSPDGGVHDPNRIDYLRGYLTQYRRAAEDGVDCAGYFTWSLMDNFEWAHGYTQRFGLIHVDYATQKRTPKDSARWYSGIMASNGETL